MLLIVFFVLVSLCMLTTNNEIIAPQSTFCIAFLFSITYAIGYVKMWSLDPSTQTFFVIAGGGVLFVIVSTLTGWAYDAIHRDEIRKARIPLKTSQFDYIVPHRWKLVVPICIQLATLLLTIQFLKDINVGSIAAAMNYYRIINMFTEDSLYMPSYLSQLRAFCIASGYVWSYILANNIVFKVKRNRGWLILNLLLSITNGVMTGGRASVIGIVIAFAVQYYIIYQRRVGWKRFFTFKKILKVGIIGAVSIVVFVQSINWLGRTLKVGFGEYIAIYLSAELKNLDIFIRKGIFGASPDRWQTSIYFINFLARRGFHPEWLHKTDIPFQTVNGHNLGNVYTIFYSFIYDGGYLAVVFFITLMAIICQVLFKTTHIWRERDQNKINISIIIYSYLYFGIVFCFFSDFFYESLLNINFLKYVLTWYILKIFLPSRKKYQ